jgi:hypothetical protein
MEAFVEKECWSTIIYKQNALVSGNGATGKLFVYSSYRDPPGVHGFLATRIRIH